MVAAADYLASIDPTTDAANDAELTPAAQQRLLVHDMRGPLTALASTLSFMGMTAGDETGELVKESLDAVRRMTELLENATTQIDLEHRPPVALAQVSDLSGAVSQSLEAVGDAVAVREARLLTAVEPEAQVRCDPKLLKRLVSNVVSNALEYLDFHGEVSVTVTTAADRTTLTVADSGPTVAAQFTTSVLLGEAQPALRQRGVRIGKGMSLVVAHDIATRHGGDLRVTTDTQGRHAVVVEFPALG